MYAAAKCLIERIGSAFCLPSCSSRWGFLFYEVLTSSTFLSGQRHKQICVPNNNLISQQYVCIFTDILTFYENKIMSFCHLVWCNTICKRMSCWNDKRRKFQKIGKWFPRHEERWKIRNTLKKILDTKILQWTFWDYRNDSYHHKCHLNRARERWNYNV